MARPGPKGGGATGEVEIRLGSTAKRSTNSRSSAPRVKVGPAFTLVGSLSLTMALRPGVGGGPMPKMRSSNIHKENCSEAGSN
jgi:hypothetical protein